MSDRRPTEKSLLKSYLLSSTAVSSSISLQDLRELFPAHYRNDPSLKALHKHLSSQVQARRAQVKRNIALEVSLPSNKREEDAEDNDASADGDTEDYTLADGSRPVGLGEAIRMLQAEEERLGEEVDMMEAEVKALVEEMKSRVPPLSDLITARPEQVASFFPAGELAQDLADLSRLSQATADHLRAEKEAKADAKASA